MKASKVRLVVVVVVAVAIGATYIVSRYIAYARREAFIAHCVDHGDGEMFTSRQYCEERYARSIAKH